MEEHGGADVVRRLGGMVGVVDDVGVRCGLLLVDSSGGPFLNRTGEGGANTSGGGGGLLLGLLSADQGGVALRLAKVLVASAPPSLGGIAPAMSAAKDGARRSQDGAQLGQGKEKNQGENPDS
jgi:hypothetical protein